LILTFHAPNPAGVGIRQRAGVFAGKGISPPGLFPGARLPTAVAVAFVWLPP